MAMATIAVNPSHPSQWRLHIQRHELGHAIGLWDATVNCWNSHFYWWPLMNNGILASCGGYGSNDAATYNEALYAAIRSGW
jgi:hypothetical protein